MEKDKNGQYSATISITTFTKILIAVGVVLFLISFIDFSGSGIGWVKAMVPLYEGVTKNIGLTCISAGLVSVVVEISTISTIVQQGINRILTGDFPIESFSSKRLGELKKQITVRQCDNEKFGISQLDSSVYSLEEELLNASKGLFYEYNKAVFIIQHDSQKGIFSKRVEFDYEIVNYYGLDNVITMSISLIHPSDDLTKDALLKKFNVKKFEIYKSDKKGKARECINITNQANEFIDVISVEGKSHSLYKYEISFRYELPKCVYNRVMLTYEYEIPDYDIIQSYKLNYPSRLLEHTIIIQDEDYKWEIAGDAYTAFFFPTIEKDYQVVQSVPNTLRVNFRDWSLTGAGYMVTFLKK